MKYILLIWGLFCMGVSLHARQTLTRQEAEEAVVYLKQEKEVVVVCRCCPDNKALRIRLQEVYYQALPGKKQYEIMIIGNVFATFTLVNGSITGYQQENYKAGEAFLLSEIFVPVRFNDNFYKTRNNLWDAAALAVVLKFQALSPCTEPFDYPFEYK